MTQGAPKDTIRPRPFGLPPARMTKEDGARQMLAPCLPRRPAQQQTAERPPPASLANEPDQPTSADRSAIRCLVDSPGGLASVGGYRTWGFTPPESAHHQAATVFAGLTSRPNPLLYLNRRALDRLKKSCSRPDVLPRPDNMLYQCNITLHPISPDHEYAAPARDRR